MLTVREQHLVQYSAGQAVLALQLSASAEEFYRALSLVRELTPQAETSTDSTGTTTVPVLSDAEAAMDAALADSAVSDIAVPQSPAVPENSVTPSPDEQASAAAHSASTPLVYSTRYLFRRQ